VAEIQVINRDLSLPENACDLHIFGITAEISAANAAPSARFLPPTWSGWF
jgi:hypothetical protein